MYLKLKDMKNAINTFAALENEFDHSNFNAMKCFENTHRALVAELNAFNDADHVSRSYKACSIKGMIQVLQYSDNEAIRNLAAKADFVFTQIS